VSRFSNLTELTCVIKLQTLALSVLLLGVMDAGAMCMPGSVSKVQRLVDDAVSKGAKVVVGGRPGPANRSDSSNTSSSAKQPQPTSVAVTTAAADDEAGGASGGWLRFGRAGSSKGKQVVGAAAKAGGAAAGGGGGGQGAALLEEVVGGGQFYPPTVLVGVTKDMLIYREEVFGPVSSARCGVAERYVLKDA
jgi:acyl-CoA reductase-like NAD-dependent aldehyde dehydrogenase